MSFGVVGPHGAGPPDLRSSAQRVRATVSGLRAAHVANGWARGEQWVHFRATPDGRQRSFVHDDGVVDEDRWRESLDGLGKAFDAVSLTALPWGEVAVGSPAHQFLGADVCSLWAQLRVPVAGVDEASGALLDELRVAAGEPGVRTGFVHVDSIADPYTEVVARDARLSADAFDVEVHGYYWAVLLGEGHLARLGGAARVRRDAPCVRVEPAGDGVLCVLTDSPLDLDEERVRGWRAFLAPVLRAGYPQGREDVGVNSGPLSRPVWLFEGEPVPETTRFVLALGHDPAGDALAVDWSDAVEDPERPTCWLHPAPAYDREHHDGAVAAVLHAWSLTGALGGLFEVEGRLGAVTGATWDTDAEGAEALVWQVDLGTCDDAGAALGRLAAALQDLAAVLAADAGGPPFVRLRIA